MSRLTWILLFALLIAGCGTLPPPTRDLSRRGPSSSASESPRAVWAQRIQEAEEVYRAGLDAYNAGDFAIASSTFETGLDRLQGSLHDAANEMDVRRRDLLTTKLSYFLRQARERGEADAALVREVHEEERGAGEAHFSDYPLEMNARVARQLEFFRAGIHDRLQVYITRSGRYGPMMRSALRENGLPEDLVFLSLIESGFSPNAYSRAHAAGLWQFIQSTGRLYGLKVDKWVDERRDPEKATRAAVRHLKDLHASLGDWNLALAAYNCGEGRVSNAVERQGTRNFWDLDLPRQTEEYVPRFMAAVYIGKDPEAHGFRSVFDPPIEHETVIVNRSIRLSRIAETCGVSVQDLRELNPSLRRDATPPDRGGFELHLPAGKVALLTARLEELSREPEPELPQATGSRTHIVRRGETLSDIARRYGTTHQAIAKANRMRAGSIIRAGQRLRIPDELGVGSAESARDPRPEPVAVAKANPPRGSGARDPGAQAGAPTAERTHTVRRGETIAEISRRYGLEQDEVLRWNAISARDRIHPGQKIRLYPAASLGSGESRGEKTYTIQPGDSLWSIARRFHTTVEAILGLNRLNPKAVLRPGNRIRVVTAAED